MTVPWPLPKDSNHELKRAKVAIQPALSFSKKDKFGTIQPHDDALVVTLKIGGPSSDQVKELIGSQSTARKCMVAAVRHQAEGESSTSNKNDYHQIPLALDNQGKTVFVTPIGNYHYKVMPFVLKNAGATYQRMMTRMFELQLGRSIEVDVDDMVVKSKVVSKHVGNLGNIFEILRKHKLCLNASKCSFGLKEYLSQPPVMSRPEVDEVLFAYLAMASHAISLVLIKVDNGVQRPVYYMSKSLHEAEIRYLPLEKAILIVVHATCKLPHNFQSHTVVVLTQLPLRSLLRSANYMGMIAKWGTILGAFDIKYMPRTSVKGQILTDLVAEFAEHSLEENTKTSNMNEKSVGMISLKESLSWKVYVDGVANQRGSGLRLVVISLEKIVIEKSLRVGFSATNNEAEYEALLVGMTMVQKMGGKTVEMFSDSRLVVGQVEGELEARDHRMQEYLSQVRHLQSNFESFTLMQIPRNRNTHAKSLATLATSSAQSLPRVILVEDLRTPTKMNVDIVCVYQIRVGPSWMDPVVLYLKENILP
ncbi:uncharacterized protein LOC142620269 [Castanea sativa]|uniref:uncharacterized protein LOC142620269 n=1 Tax=Castanea sativa TaxID=21020 RepID=UPI003F64BCAF